MVAIKDVVILEVEVEVEETMIKEFDKCNSNSNSSRGCERQHYLRSNEEISNNDRRYDKRLVGCYNCHKFSQYSLKCKNKVEENANYAEKDE